MVDAASDDVGPDKPQFSGRNMDPLAGSIGRAKAHRQVLMKKAGEFLSDAEVENLLGADATEIAARREARHFLAVRLSSERRYPAFQFCDGAVLDGLGGLLKAHADSDPWVIIDTLLAEDDALRGRTLLQVLRERDEQAISRHIAQIDGDGFA